MIYSCCPAHRAPVLGVLSAALTLAKSGAVAAHGIAIVTAGKRIERAAGTGCTVVVMEEATASSFGFANAGRPLGERRRGLAPPRRLRGLHSSTGLAVESNRSERAEFLTSSLLQRHLHRLGEEKACSASFGHTSSDYCSKRSSPVPQISTLCSCTAMIA